MKKSINRIILKIFLIILTLIIVSGFAFAGANLETNFFKIFSKPNLTTIGNSIVEIPDGYLIVGSIFDDAGPNTWGWVIKTNKKGEKIWEKELGKKALDSSFNNAAIINDRLVALVGSVNSRISFTQEISSGWIVEQNLNGNIEWDKNLQLGTSTCIMDVKPTKKDEIVLVGRIREKNKDAAFIIEMDANGRKLWTKEIRKGYWADKVLPLEKGGFLIWNRSLVARLDNKGDVLWEHNVSRVKNKHLTTIVASRDGGFIIGGDFENQKQHYIWIIRLDSDGKIIWEKKNEISELCSMVSLLTTDKGIIAIGGTCKNVKEKIWLASVSKFGKMKLLKKFKVGKDEKIKKAILCGQDEFIAVGNDFDVGEGNSAAWIFKGNFN